jgi:hypothetical protein
MGQNCAFTVAQSQANNFATNRLARAVLSFVSANFSGQRWKSVISMGWLTKEDETENWSISLSV